MLRRIFGFVVSGRDASELFEAVEHPFNTVLILIGSEVAGRRIIPVSLWWNDRPDPVDQQFLAQEVAIVALVGKKQFRFTNWYCH